MISSLPCLSFISFSEDFQLFSFHTLNYNYYGIPLMYCLYHQGNEFTLLLSLRAAIMTKT